MHIVKSEDIAKLNISSSECYRWIDHVLMNRDEFVLPPKTRMLLEGSDYCNIMPGISYGGVLWRQGY